MNPKNLMLSALAVGALACLVWFGFLRQPDGVAPAPVPAALAPATLSAIDGAVSVSPNSGEAGRPGAPPEPLRLGDVVSTGPAGAANVLFTDRAMVHLGPNASMVIGDQGGAAVGVGGVLLAGEAQVKTVVPNRLGFSIGTPLGVVALPQHKLSQVEVHFDQGMKVLTGEVELKAPGSSVGQVVLSGQEITLDGLGVAANTGAIDGLSIAVAPPAPKPLSPSLRRRRGLVRTRSKGARGWRLTRGPSKVDPGDVVGIGAQGAATLQLHPAMRIELGPAAQLRLAAAEVGESGPTAQAELTGGAAEVALESAATLPPQAQLRVAGANLHILPTDKEASVDVVPAADGARIYVRFGALRVGDAAPIAAGNTLRVKDGKIVEGPTAAFAAAAEARLGQKVQVATDMRTAPVRFVLPRGQAGNTRHLQVASDASFAQLSSAEAVQADTFAQDRLPMGDSFWRMTDDPSQVGQIHLERAHEGSCVSCRKENVIADTGESVVVRYETQTPNLTFTWASLPGAKSYTWRLYRASNLTQPLMTQALTATSHAPAQPLEVGTYYWYVDAHSDSPAGPQPGQMNTLSLDYQPAGDGFDLQFPNLRQRIRRPTLTSVGRIDPAASLSINGQPVKALADGTFRHRTALKPGSNQLIYRLLQPQRPDRYELRTVLYKP